MILLKKETGMDNPWAELERLIEGVLPTAGTAYARTIPLNAYATGDEKVLELELPGVSKKDITLTYEKGLLEVEAVRKSYRNNGNKEIKLARSIQVGTDINYNKAKASLENGILEIHLPINEHNKPRKISIE